MNKSRTGVPSFFGKTDPSGFYDGGGTWYTLSMPEMAARSQELLELHWKQWVRRYRIYPYPNNYSETFYSTDFKRPKWNECSHVKEQFSYSYPISFISWGGSSFGCVNHMQHYGWTTQLPLTNPTVDEASDFTRARAWATLMPRFESDFKALNFIYELKDWKHIGKAVANSLKPGSPLFTSLVNAGPKCSTVKVAKRKPIVSYRKSDMTCAEAFDKGSNSFAEAWLFNSFAIQPTLKDLIALRAALATEYLDALDKFKESGLAPNTRHYSEDIRDDSYDMKYTNLLTGGLERRIDKSRFTANLQYQYQYKLDNTAEAFRRYWGLTGTAEELWNMLPFSFLLDYVFSVAKALKASEVDKNLDLTVVQYCESVLSIKGQQAAFTNVNTSANCGFIVDGVYFPSGKIVPFMGSHNSVYTRKLVQPTKYGLLLPQWKLPSLNQAYNVGALVKLLLF